MRHAKFIFILAGFTLISIATLIGIMTISGNYLAKATAQHQATRKSCTQTGADISVVIKNNTASPKAISAKVCDVLTITNLDNVNRVIAFGEHGRHIPYDDITDKKLAQGQSFSILLRQAGSFKLHDHLNVNVTSSFTVAE